MLSFLIAVAVRGRVVDVFRSGRKGGAGAVVVYTLSLTTIAGGYSSALSSMLLA